MPGMSYITVQDLDSASRRWKRLIEPVAENTLAALVRPALLVVDMQRYFTDAEGRAYLPAAHAIMPAVKRLVAAFERVRRPVLFTRHGHARGADAGLMQSWWHGRLLYEDDPDAAIDPALDASAKRVIGKRHYDAFRDTDLGSVLASAHTHMLVVCGVMTDLCVETTARQAFMEGFQPVVALDATATGSEELHLSALKTLAHGFAYVERADHIIDCVSCATGTDMTS